MRSVARSRVPFDHREPGLLIGRRAELALLRQRLTGPDRLVTLTGPGGNGKSCLARTAAAELARSFPDGAWLVELEDLVDVQLLPATVARSMGLQVASGHWELHELVEALRERRALLVLDGCDGLLQDSAELVDRILRGCPDMRVMATSRQPLRIPGESVLGVPPLDHPDPGRTYDVDELAAYDAVALFVERAATVLPSFRLTDDNADAVVGICAALEGVPLALTLAAARVTVLSPQAILDRLRDRHRLLTKGERDAGARQQSLRASVAASYDVCTEEERTLWGRLSVFTGSFDLETVEEVCSGDGLDELDILDLVDSLLEKSVLTRIEDDPSHVRYRMLESLRTFGAELLPAEEADHWRERHLQCYAALVQEAAGEWFNSKQAEWSHRFRRDRTNIRAALEYAVTRPDRAVDAMRIVTGLDAFWVIAGLLTEARHWLHRALEAAPEQVADREATAAALVTGSWFALLQMDLAESADLLERARAQAVGEATPGLRVRLLTAEAGLATWRGDLVEAGRLLHEVTGLARAEHDPAGEATAWTILGLGLGVAGELDEAVAAERAALAVAEAAGELHIRSYALGLLALCEFDLGDPETAEQHARQALQLKVELEDQFATALTYEAMSWMAAARQQGQRAAVLLGASDALWRGLGIDLGQVPYLSQRREQGMALVHGLLSDRDFRTTFEQGARLSAEAAVRYALEGVLAESEKDAAEESPLTPREVEVARLIGKGLSNREIAEALVISQRTAQGHVENILRKLAFTSRTQVAAWVVERDIR